MPRVPAVEWAWDRAGSRALWAPDQAQSQGPAQAPFGGAQREDQAGARWAQAEASGRGTQTVRPGSLEPVIHEYFCSACRPRSLLDVTVYAHRACYLPHETSTPMSSCLPVPCELTLWTSRHTDLGSSLCAGALRSQ